MIDKKIKNVVGKSFIRVIKNHDLYNLFITSCNSQKKDSPFNNFTTFQELMDQVEEYTINNKDKFFRENDKYGYITTMINHMLHFFLEIKGISPHLLGLYGKEIFDLSCYTLYGDEYKDETELDEDIPAPTNELEAFILNEYIRHKESGLLNSSWEEFNNYMRKRLNKAMNNGEIC